MKSETAVSDPLTTSETAANGADNLPKIALKGVLSGERTQVNAGGISLMILATIAFIFALQWARDFFIPVTLGILIAYTLNPVVVWLERIKVPRVIGASLVMLGLLASTAGVVTSVYNEVQAIMDEVPVVTYKLTNALKRSSDGKVGVLDRLQNMTDAVKKAASPASDKAADNTAVPSAKPEAKPPEFNLTDWLWAGSISAAGFIGRLVTVLFLVFFALLSGDIFKRKLVKLTGPSLSDKKVTVHILDDINTSIQSYMFMLLVTNTLLALITWAVMHWIGLDNAGAWAVASGLLHIIPYFGPLITALAMGFVAFLQFESFSMVFLVITASLAIATVVGTLVMTWMTGRIAKMNATAVFIGLLFGGWLWGAWGLLLCVPVIVVIRVISERIEGMQPIAELLGE